MLKNKVPLMILRYCTRRNIGTSLHKSILYGDDASPPVRFVKMTASILNVDLEYRFVDLFKNENRTEFYKGINHLQKVPALVIRDGDVICDSHAIAVYLCETSFNQTLYPENPLHRARINQMLFYNASVLFPIDSYILSNYFARNLNYKEKYEQWHSALDYLELTLKNRNWLAGDQVTLCDLCIVSTVSSMLELTPLAARHARVDKWIKTLQLFPFYAINKSGLQRLARFIDMFKVENDQI